MWKRRSKVSVSFRLDDNAYDSRLRTPFEFRQLCSFVGAEERTTPPSGRPFLGVAQSEKESPHRDTAHQQRVPTYLRISLSNLKWHAYSAAKDTVFGTYVSKKRGAILDFLSSTV